MLTPWPPLKSGVAEYAYQVASELRALCDLTIVPTPSAEYRPLADCQLLDLEGFAASEEEFDGVIVHLGNNTDAHTDHHRWLLSSRRRTLTVLHDVQLQPFLEHSYLFQGDLDPFLQVLDHEVSGADRRALERRLRSGETPALETPVAGHLLAKGHVIVHNRFSRDLLLEHYAHLGQRVILAPHATGHREPSRPAGGDRFEIACFGFVNSHKRPDVAIAAYNLLRTNGFNVRLRFVGETNDDGVDLESLKRDLIPDPRNRVDVTQTGFVSNGEFEEIMSQTDVVWNLRHPTMGESSGTLHLALALGVPTIVTDSDQFAEYPDDIVWKAGLGPDETAELFQLTSYLLSNRSVRETIGRRSRAWAHEVLSFQDTARGYLNHCLSQEASG